MSNLLPCPFCGGKAEEFECEETDNIGGSVIGCTKCMASTCVFFGDCYGLVDAWNRRTTAKIEANLSAIQAELDGADKVIANLKSEIRMHSSDKTAQNR